jgi:hypothetical protein
MTSTAHITACTQTLSAPIFRNRIIESLRAKSVATATNHRVPAIRALPTSASCRTQPRARIVQRLGAKSRSTLQKERHGFEQYVSPFKDDMFSHFLRGLFALFADRGQIYQTPQKTVYRQNILSRRYNGSQNSLQLLAAPPGPGVGFHLTAGSVTASDTP